MVVNIYCQATPAATTEGGPTRKGRHQVRQAAEHYLTRVVLDEAYVTGSKLSWETAQLAIVHTKKPYPNPIIEKGLGDEWLFDDPAVGASRSDSEYRTVADWLRSCYCPVFAFRGRVTQTLIQIARRAYAAGRTAKNIYVAGPGKCIEMAVPLPEGFHVLDGGDFALYSLEVNESEASISRATYLPSPVFEASDSSS